MSGLLVTGGAGFIGANFECAFAPRISLQAGLGATVGWYMERVDKLKAGWQRTALAL